MTDKTIFARASGAGRAGVAVFRVSGPMASHVIEKSIKKELRPRMVERIWLRDDQDQRIDDGLALWFPGPASFTGEDVLELHLHGSPAVEHRLTTELLKLGLTPAGPGAFTMRAFANGKLDLTQAEGLASLLEAETELQHRQAIAQLRGALRDQADAWRRDLTQALAMLDAAVDFPDEEDVPGAVAAGARPAVQRVSSSLEGILAASQQAKKVADGLTVAIIGPPNAGKSSLFNKIIGDERAIVSDEAGTTRDIISAKIDFSGHLISFLDTAGIREKTPSSVEAEGIRRAWESAKGADLRILLYPAGEDALPDWMEELRASHDMVLRSKADLSGDPGFSVRRAADVQQLKSDMAQLFDRMAAPGLAPTARQQHLLASAREELEQFDAVADTAPELAAEAVRLAARRLEELTGRIAPDDVLGDIFSSFCIGK